MTDLRGSDSAGEDELLMAPTLPHTAIKPAIGAIVSAPKDALLSGGHTAVLRDLLETAGVIVFPQLNLSADEQIAFTRTLGEYVPDRADGQATRISIDPDDGASAEYTKASFFWHFDGYMHEVPVLGSLLCCEAPSASGGDTEFCNTYAAWDALPDDRKAAVAGLRAVHALAGAQISVEPEPSYATFARWRGVHHSTLPIVWRHRSGRRSLLIGNTAVGVCGLDPLEGLDLLVWLRDWATQERFSYRHRWQAGDAVLWDNTGTLHRATPYPAGSGRSMRRTKLAGEEPFA